MSADFDYDSILSESCILADALQIDDKEGAPTSAPQPPTQQPQPPAQQPPVRRPVAPPMHSKPAPSRTVPSSQPVSALADVGNLGRLAMFGNRPQVKRRSQLRREAEAAAKTSEPVAKNAEPVAISRPRAPTPRGGHLSRGSTPGKVPVRSSGHPASYDGPVTRSRATVRSGGMLVPSQADFVKGIRERQRSGSSASRVPVRPVQRMASLTRAAPIVPVVAKRSVSHTRTAVPAKNTVPVRPGSSGNIPLLPNRTFTGSRDGSRKPVLVKQSPGVAFGSALSADKRRPYQERLRGTPVFKTTPKKATSELRAYPGPSGTTPLVRPLTVTETPQVMKRRCLVAKTPQAQNVFERLARPLLRTPAPIARTGVPNTVSHGIRVPTVQRSRDGSNTPLKRNPMAMEN